LESKLSGITGANWEVLKLHVEFQGARVVETA